MENWLKALIATACGVVIVGGGYFVYSEYREDQVAKAAAEERAVRNSCRSAIGKPLPALKEFCVEEGYLTYEEAQR
ncbi:hypothetical protein H7H48_02200 [Nitratireductor sp. B36]|uniref:hypothetical protein n=1 Tax=Nitratireductor sp. B36 TaxID=2762059 RepID=UPI001E2DB1D0|nr:hypothetical protein [Nitratireductor sp. B36]MCC5777848.1 hypothetical protein [Nitratireductor sp. B36]